MIDLRVIFARLKFDNDDGIVVKLEVKLTWIEMFRDKQLIN